MPTTAAASLLALALLSCSDRSMTTYRKWQIFIRGIAGLLVVIFALAVAQVRDMRIYIPMLIAAGIVGSTIRCPHCGWSIIASPRRHGNLYFWPRRECPKCGGKLD